MKKSILIFIIPLVYLISTSGKYEDNLASQDLKARLNDYEKIMDRYFRGNPRESALALINSAVREHNGWLEAGKNDLDAQREKLTDELKQITPLEKQIDALDEKLTRIPDPTDEKAVKAYNAEMEKRTALANKYNNLVTEYQEHESTFNSSVARFNSEKEERKKKLDAQKAQTMEVIKAIDQWFKEKKDQAFFVDLNNIYGDLIQERNRTGSFSMDEYIDRLRALRHELGTYATTKQNKEEYGFIIVPLTLGSNVECFYIVDTGASLVTITPELVKMLGLSENVGKEIEISLAGGIVARGREIVIPLMSVLGKTAQDVPAVVLQSSLVGADGLLGRSFLKKFIVCIDDANQPKLMLEYRVNR
jgi:hypothetical protein